MNQAFYVSLAEWSQVAASVLFIGILVYIWVRFLNPGIIRSQERKNAELAETERRRDAAEADIDDARRDVAATDSEIAAITARAAHDAKAVGDRIVSGAAAEGRRVIANAEGELERARLAARERLRDELVAQAISIARSAAAYTDEATNRRLIGETVDAVDRHETV
ncbi:MAG: hypothetical protein M3R44_03330 [Candidatus Eremiobacteraeota bacterium]|nr:hypothetical protein [Candidatus Eremiobacteraeota bacterium]